MSQGTIEPQLMFLRSQEDDPPVTVVRDMRVRRGFEAPFEEAMKSLIAEASEWPGHLGATVLRPKDTGAGSPDCYRFVYKFDRRSNLVAWHSSEARDHHGRRAAQYVLSDRSTEFPGLETWFDLPGPSAPVKWKSTAVTWAAIYVLVVAFSYVLQALDLVLSIPVGSLVLTGVIVPLVAHVVGPFLGRVLHPWLHAGGSTGVSGGL